MVLLFAERDGVAGFPAVIAARPTRDDNSTIISKACMTRNSWHARNHSIGRFLVD
jgi:hypothetical protein